MFIISNSSVNKNFRQKKFYSNFHDLGFRRKIVNSIGKHVYNRILLILIRFFVRMNFKVLVKLNIVFSKLDVL